MADASISVDQDQFSCPVCLDLLKDPVTIPCGHSYCMVCINGCWDQEDQRGVYSCPQCRETFTPRPVLRRNNMLAEVVEKLKKTELRAAPPAPCYAGPGDVECDFCTGRKLKAVKSCLSEVKDMQRKSQQRLQEKEKELQEVKQAVKTLKSSAQAAVEDSERIFTQLIRSIEKKRSEVTELIRAQEKTELSQAEELLEKLEQEIADLQRRDTELEQLEHTEDHIQFLQSFQSLCVSSGSNDSPSTTVHQHPSFDGVRKSLSDLKERLEEFWKQGFSKIPPQDYCRLTLDPNTMHHYLSQSEENRVVTCSNTVQSYPDHPERFDKQCQVLSKESVSGRCYWEVEWRGESWIYIKDESIFNSLPSSSYYLSGIVNRIQRTENTVKVQTSRTRHCSAVCECRKMAEASISVDQDQFSCPVCLDLLKDPVTIPCGHSYCKACINGHWDQKDQRGVYSCPQCRETFTPRPVLRRNNMLAEVVEKLKRPELRAAPPAPCYAGPGDVECDFCTGRKFKAVKSCLVCVASLCEAHLQPHLEVPALTKHKLAKVCPKLQEKICPKHDKLMEIYCRTDQTCICYLCMIQEHNRHETVAAVGERGEKQMKLKTMKRESWERLQKKEKKLQEVKQAMSTLKSSAQAAVEDSERIFTQLIRSIEKKRSEVTELIRAQEKTELSRAEELLEKLEQEIADLKRRDAELEQLEHTEDHIQFLQSFQSLCVSSGSDSPIIISQHLSFDGVRKSLSDLKERLEELCMEEFLKIHPRDYCQLTLDPNTVNYYLTLSEENTVVSRSVQCQLYSDHPDRFDPSYQVLSKESVSGRCYWEVEWSSSLWGMLSISVSYKGISRKGRGNERWLGYNDQSWSLQCSPALSYWHNYIKTAIKGPSSSRIGVYVDHSAGTLSFYSVSDTMTLLHTVHTTFTQPLYAGIGFYGGIAGVSSLTCEESEIMSDQSEMADASISVDQDRFSCPVCLDLLKDPVTIPCGHSYCMVCINGCWDQEDQRGVYSCPQCRETFTPRPVLRRNNMLAEVVEEVKQKLQTASLCYAGPGDVECDFCTGRKLKAVKSCLVCLASYCEAHLQPHYQSPAFKKHKLVPALPKLQEKICSQHDRLIEVYCRTDQSCICYLCTMEEHKGHDTVSASTERTQKQSEVKDMQRKFQQRLQEKEKELQEVKRAVKTLKSSAQAAVEDSERIFTQLIRSIEKKRSEVTELIRAQEKTELSRAEELLEKLEQEIADLKRRDTELEQLEHTEDHIQFLQSFQSLCVSPGYDPSPININQRPSFDGVRKSLSDLKERLEEFWKQEFRTIPPHDYCRLTLDPNTVNQKLSLSEMNTEATYGKIQPYPDHPERFDCRYQVLSKESSFQSLCVSPGSGDSPSITGERIQYIHQHPSFDGVRRSLFELKERLEEFCKQEFRNIPKHSAAPSSQ
ncbi:hypothetical protein NFI96_007746 [Prochilodus magdalenae]|nr:hypothetical protein NFI96_007746 [Prochilodus magdalenae]